MFPSFRQYFLIIVSEKCGNNEFNAGKRTVCELKWPDGLTAIWLS